MSEKRTDELLVEEINDCLVSMAALAPGEEEYDNATDNVVKLYNKKIEEDKNDIERRKLDIKEKELELEIRKFNKESKTNIVFKALDLGVKVTGIVVPLIVYDKWQKRGYHFEETGNVVSKTFKDVIQGAVQFIRPKK